MNHRVLIPLLASLFLVFVNLMPTPAHAATRPVCWYDTGTHDIRCLTSTRTNATCWWDDAHGQWACPDPTQTWVCWRDTGTGLDTCYTPTRASARCWWATDRYLWACPDLRTLPAPSSSPTPPPAPSPAPSPGPSPTPAPTPPGATNGWQVAYTTTFGDLNRWQSGYYWGNRGGNGELETYTRSQVQALPGGGMTITADHMGGSYPSGLMTTKDYQTFGPGIYTEASIQIPRGQGLWPAFWLLSTQNPAGNPDELDVMEILSRATGTLYSTLHTYAGQQQIVHTGPDLSTGVHRYGMWWEADRVIFYLDGTEIGRITNRAVIPQTPAYLLVNLAVGGNWPGNPDGSTPFPATMTVQSIGVWIHGSTLPAAPPR